MFGELDNASGINHPRRPDGSRVGPARVGPVAGARVHHSRFSHSSPAPRIRACRVTAIRRPSAAFDGKYADPNLVIIDGTYYLYPTTDGQPEWGARSFRAFSSQDLDEWTDHGEILRLGVDVAWASSYAWAPAVVRKGDTYFLYFTAESNIGVASGPSPTGPFTDLGRPLVADGDFSGRAIDPSAFLDVDGTWYLYWGNGVAHAVPLGDDMMSFDASRVESWHFASFREAPWVHRDEDRYYLSWSENDTREATYRVRYATGPGPLGPWAEQGVLLQQRRELGIHATGHHSIAQLSNGNWVIAYHRFAIPGGNGYNREIVIDPLVHDASGLIEPVIPSVESLRLLPASPSAPIQ